MTRNLYLYDSRKVGQAAPDWTSLHRLETNADIESGSDTVNGNDITVFRLIGESPTEAMADVAQNAKSQTLLWLRDQAPFDIIVSNYSRMAEDLLETINMESHRFPKSLLPMFFIRFSEHYGSTQGARDNAEYLKTLGFRFDCPPDYGELYSLLTFPQFIEAVENRSWEKIAQAIDEFNASFTKTPILIF